MQRTPNAILGPQHAWIWAALPAEPGSAEVRGDPGLVDALTDAGWSVTADADGAVASEAIVRGVAALPDGGLLVLVPVNGGARAAAATLRLGRRLRTAELDLSWIGTGDRSRRHRLRVAPQFRPARGCRRPILVATRGTRPAAAVARARAAAETAAGGPLSPRGIRALSGGTLLVELDAPGGRRLLRVAGGSGGRLLERSEAVRGTLASSAPATVRERLVAPAAGGAVAAVRWTLEPRVDGSPPRRLSKALRADCFDFLVALRRTPAAGGIQGPARHAAALQPWLGTRQRGVLERVAARIDERLSEVARGWIHGDFWTGNLLVRGGRLAHVLDWDAAASDGLPLLDLLHLTAYGDRRLRRLPHGLRCTDGLWPLAAAGGNPEIRRYCAATATPSDPATLEALAVAYWLERVARDLSTFADRGRRSQWMADNVHRPLDCLEARGW